MLLFTTFHIIVIAGLAAAATIPAIGNNSRILGENDVIVFGNSGRVEIMDKSVYANLSKTAYDPHPGPLPTQAELVSASNYSSQDNLKKLQPRCDYATIYSFGNTADFLDWDVPMSSIVHAGNLSSTVSVASGYSVANMVSVTAGYTDTLVENVLSVQFSVSYSYTWTTTTTDSYIYTVPPGKYGVIVSNPQTHRIYGNVVVGCVAQTTDVYGFIADSRQSQSSGGLSWVEGVISLCTSNTYPVHRCLGDGFLY